MTDIIISRETDWDLIAEAANITQGWDPESLNVGQWNNLLRAEHSPIYLMQIAIRFIGVPYYVSTHLVRHHVGVNHFVRSQRPDCMNPVDYDRAEAPQGALVDHMMVVNPGSLISIAKDRLCFKAWHVTQDLMWRVKAQLEEDREDFMREVGRAMLPKCIYRGFCTEHKSCGFFARYRQRPTRDKLSVYRAHASWLAHKTDE